MPPPEALPPPLPLGTMQYPSEHVVRLLHVWHTSPPEPHANGVTPNWQTPALSQQPVHVAVLHFSFG